MTPGAPYPCRTIQFAPTATPTQNAPESAL
jgi:hypothetical protein